MKLVTSFDAMERIWGGQRSAPWVEDTMSAGTRAEAENIAMNKVYIDYTSIASYDSIDFKSRLRDLVHKTRPDKGVITSRNNV
jgi:hypothetical protein